MPDSSQNHSKHASCQMSKTAQFLHREENPGPRQSIKSHESLQTYVISDGDEDTMMSWDPLKLKIAERKGDLIGHHMH